MTKAKTGVTKKKQGPAPVLPPVQAAPAGSAPAAPANFQRLTNQQVRELHKATTVQTSGFPAVAAEINAAGATYAADFGNKAMPSVALAASFQTAAAWAAEAARAALWSDYAHEQSLLAAHAVLGHVVTVFKKDFDAAATHDPGVPTRWPALAAVVTARKAAARKGVQTKTKKKAALKVPVTPPKA